MKKTITLLILGCPLFLLGQTQKERLHIDELFRIAFSIKTRHIDSVKIFSDSIRHLSTSKSYTKGITLSKLLDGYTHYYNRNLDSAEWIYRESLEFFELNEGMKNSVEHGQAHLILSYVYYDKQEYFLSKSHATHALKIFKNLIHNNVRHKNLHQLEWSVYLVLGGIEGIQSNYEKSLEYFLTTFRKKMEMGEHESRLIPEIINISVVYDRIGQDEDAVRYARRALRLSQKYGEGEREISAYIALAAGLRDLKRYDSTFFYYNMAMERATELNLSRFHGIIRQNIANAYSGMGEYRKAISLVKSNVSTNPSERVRYISSVTIADCYLKLKLYDSAILIAKPAIEEYTLDKAPKESIVTLTDIIAKAYASRGDFKNAYNYQTLNQELYDSLINEESDRKLSSLYVEVETLAKQHEIDILRSERLVANAEYRQLWITTISGATTSALVVVLIVFMYKNRQKKQKLETIELQKELELKNAELHQQTMRIIAINNGIAEIEENLKKIQREIPGNYKDVQGVLNSIRISRVVEKEWKNFDEYFGNVHKGFYERCEKIIPSLTIAEKRLAGLVRMNLTNAEIAAILNVETNSVKMAKYRLKKKLGLNDNQDMLSHLLMI
jgi:tetratricopeptide (TPR) repeat protein/DNA-binding CsgD family transcriptional regulator